MKRQLKDYKLFIVAIIFYILGALVFAWFEYQNNKKLALQSLDEKLLAAVSVAEHLLQQRLRANIAGTAPLTSDEDYLLAMSLQELADDLGVEYIYSLVKKGDGYFFIASNPTPKELQAVNTYDMAYMAPYEDAPAVLDEVFASGEHRFTNYSDQWGDFRSVFFPFSNPRDKPYVIGVDINISELHKLAYISLRQALAYSLFLALIAFPLISLYIGTIRRNYREKLEASGRHALTGLGNQHSLEVALTNTPRDHLLLIEIENFDYITSVLGVAATDALLLRLVYRLQELQLPKVDECQWFHLNDHRLALFSTYPFSDSEVRVITSGIFRALTEGNETWSQRDAPLVIRMGAVTGQENALMLAGMALIHAKQTNQSFVNYDANLELPKYFKRYIKLFSMLKEALQHDRIRVFFQPILDVSTGRVVKHEALVRIVDTEGQIISSPDEFMPIAYQSRLCHKVTRVVLARVINVLKGTEQVVSINLSVKDLFDEKTRTHIIQQIRHSGIGGQIEFELLEQQAITQYSTAAAYIKQLKSCVSAVGMDDLGKLYSNFDRLFSLPIDFVKIDGMVIEAMEQDSDAKSIIEGIVTFARQKGIMVIAEHCYNQATCDMVVLMNVDLLQGFYIGPPTEDFLSPQVVPEHWAGRKVGKL